jgi:hypothetical protein
VNASVARWCCSRAGRQWSRQEAVPAGVQSSLNQRRSNSSGKLEGDDGRKGRELEIMDWTVGFHKVRVCAPVFGT